MRKFLGTQECCDHRVWTCEPVASCIAPSCRGGMQPCQGPGRGCWQLLVSAASPWSPLQRNPKGGCENKRCLNMPYGAETAEVLTYNASISACEEAEQWKAALDLFDAMSSSGLEPDLSLGWSNRRSPIACIRAWPRPTCTPPRSGPPNPKGECLEDSCAVLVCVSINCVWFGPYFGETTESVIVMLCRAQMLLAWRSARITYNTLVSACRSRWRLGQSLLRASLRSFNALGAACAKALCWSQVL